MKDQNWIIVAAQSGSNSLKFCVATTELKGEEIPKVCWYTNKCVATTELKDQKPETKPEEFIAGVATTELKDFYIHSFKFGVEVQRSNHINYSGIFYTLLFVYE